jgi:hypothetical protein
MTILKGALTARRYRARGAVPDSFRQDYEEALTTYAFHEPSSKVHGEEVEGWVLVQNLLDTDFSQRDRWLMNHYVVAALRVDRRTVPAKLFKAHLDKRLAAWCQENGRARAPASVRGDLGEALRAEMLSKTLPRVAVHEFCWNLAEGWVLFAHTSDATNDRFRKRFLRTFGLELEPFSPLQFLDPELAGRLEITGLSDLHVRAEA